MSADKTMSNDATRKSPAKGPSAGELYRIAAFTSAILFTWTAWSAYEPSPLVVALLVIMATMGLASKTTLGPVVFLVAFFLLEVFSSRSRSMPTQFVLVGSLLGLLAFTARAIASAEPIRRFAPPRRGFWKTLSTPIRQLFRREAPTPPPSPEGSMDEVVKLLLAVILAVVGGWLVLRNAPVEAFRNIRMGLPWGAATIAAVLLPFAVGLTFARLAFWFVDPKRKDPKLAEMELNELVWSELRPEMTRVGAFLGNAAAKQPELSTPGAREKQA